MAIFKSYVKLPEGNYQAKSARTRPGLKSWSKDSKDTKRRAEMTKRKALT